MSPRISRTVAAVRLVVLLLAWLIAAGPGEPAHAAGGLPPDWQRGANVTAWWHDAYGQPGADTAMADLRATRATHVAIVPTWYMEHGSSSTIAADPLKTPSDASLRHAIDVATGLGLSVSLKPHVDVRDGTFRGDIHPASTAGWFSSYRTMLIHYADLARESGANTVIVGTELTSMSRHAGEWVRLIADARSRFPGDLTFAANHAAGAREIAFWNKLDYIGIDAYMPLGDEANPSVDQLARAWHERCYVDQLAELHRRHGKPVVFTELGYQSREWTAATPWWTDAPVIDAESQANAYEAAYRVWSRVPWFKGIYFWEWRAGGYDPNDGSFSPRGKTAEQVMREWNTGAEPHDAPAANCADRTPSAADSGAPPPAPSPSGAPPPGAEPPPVATEEPTPAASRLGRARVHVAVRRRARGVILVGRVGEGARRCRGRVVVRVERTPRRRRAVARVARRTSVSGRFKVRLRVRARGRYRARVSSRTPACAQARSKYVDFRI